VTKVEQIEATVRDDELLPARAYGSPPRRQLIPGNDFLPKIHAPFWTNPFDVGNLFALEKGRDIALRCPRP
jgi:hypothetical protein